jgi:hypothetical protein
MEKVTAWFGGRLPDEWFEEAPEITWDRDEIHVIGRLPDVGAEGGEEAVRQAREGRIQRFREETRGPRMRIADEAERRFGRKVAWGARCGDVGLLFTNLSVPVMTRLRLKERRVLDTLVDAGVARSRSEALAWCVKLVGKNEDEWIGRLRDAMVAVEQVRAAGPQAS